MAPPSSSKPRAANFKSAEVDRLLEIARRLLPFGGQEWEQVAEKFNEGQRTEVHRKAETLKGKYTRLRNGERTRSDTVEHVDKAREIAKLIDARAHIIEPDDLAEKEEDFSNEHALLLVEIAEDLQPQTDGVWELVASEFNDRRGDDMMAKTAKQLQTYFKSLVRKTKPTGNPTWPEHVRRAKRLHFRLANDNVLSGENDWEGDQAADKEEEEECQEPLSSSSTPAAQEKVVEPSTPTPSTSVPNVGKRTVSPSTNAGQAAKKAKGYGHHDTLYATRQEGLSVPYMPASNAARTRISL